MKTKAVKTKARKPKGKKAAKQAMMQCDSLISAIQSIQRALTMADGNGHTKKLLAELLKAHKNVHTHVKLTEAPDGLLSRIDIDAPRLSTWASQLRDEHRCIEKQVAKLEKSLLKCKDAPTPRLLKSICLQAATLMEELESHQHKGTELVFEAYMSDVGTKD